MIQDRATHHEAYNKLTQFSAPIIPQASTHPNPIRHQANHVLLRNRASLIHDQGRSTAQPNMASNLPCRNIPHSRAFRPRAGGKECRNKVYGGPWPYGGRHRTASDRVAEYTALQSIQCGMCTGRLKRLADAAGVEERLRLGPSAATDGDESAKPQDARTAQGLGRKTPQYDAFRQRPATKCAALRGIPPLGGSSAHVKFHSVFCLSGPL